MSEGASGSGVVCVGCVLVVEVELSWACSDAVFGFHLCIACIADAA